MKSIFADYLLFGDIYRNKRVLVTGHTGFKGSWLCLWLKAMGANVSGYSLPPNTKPNHFNLIEQQLEMQSVLGDIRDLENLKHTVAEFQPEIVFHLAAQPLVRFSYSQPIETLHTNIIGTANVFEACRSVDSVRAIINITSDKCYENQEWVWGYRESDPMGGYDPYSASKGCAELITSAYRSSFFNTSTHGSDHNPLLASARAGNVIGGGDWAEDRIITDMMEAASQNRPLTIRNPNATRPWQHVLEPLSGYLLIGQRLIEGKTECAGAWNFGPNDDGSFTVLDVVTSMQTHWDKIHYTIEQNIQYLHEAHLLKLDCSKSRNELGWRGVWDAQTTFETTVDWYRSYYDQGRIKTVIQLKYYICDAIKFGSCWAGKRQ